MIREYTCRLVVVQSSDTTGYPGSVVTGNHLQAAIQGAGTKYGVQGSFCQNAKNDIQGTKTLTVAVKKFVEVTSITRVVGSKGWVDHFAA